tara:strand:- start:420 stop:686 length:267 start_codon:yes stop_codon:yes gene_type:complete
MNTNILVLFEEILDDTQKHKCVDLFTRLDKEQFNNLISIWEKSSSLLRWNNIVKELRKNKITEPDILNILMLGLQHYVDKKTYYKLIR